MSGCRFSSEIWHLDLACARSFWGALVPAAFVFLLFVFAIPLPTWLSNHMRPNKGLFAPFLTLQEAEALDAAAIADSKAAASGEAGQGEPETTAEQVEPGRFWKSLLLSWFALIETLVWLGVASFAVIQDEREPVFVASPFVLALTWLFATVRPIVRPRLTPPYDLFSLYLIYTVFELVSLGAFAYNHYAYGTPIPPSLTLTAHILNLCVLFILVAIVLSMPLAIPSRGVERAKIGMTISPEDYTTLWGWVTFSWVWPLVKRGTNTTLNEDDVWALSPTIQSRSVFVKFSNTKRATLLRRLWAANSMDLILDFLLTLVSVAFNYTSPFFLKRILDAIMEGSSVTRSQAFVYAFLAFLCSMCKAQADVQHLWFGRRAATRIRSQLMAAIYDKALKRRDFSGIVNKDNSKDSTSDRKKDSKADAEARAKADDPKAGADVGKIVNLMAGDANRVAMTSSAMYFIYGSPFEIIIAGVFLYSLLGWSAFAGFLILALGWPLNSYIAKRSIRIQKGLMATRDKRMAVLNELIGAIKFIKFFAWESRWIDRVSDARATEIKWMIKARLNAVLFQLLWSCAPVLVSITSFLVFVMQGNELTVSIAFTAIALFNMVRLPLNIVPTWIVQMLQTKVALDRIATYLDEDEVDEQVSSLKRSHFGASTGDDDHTTKGLGIENGTFKWNEVEQKDDETAKTAKSITSTPTPADDAVRGSNDETERGSITASEASNHRFELRDVNIVFPERQLTVVTGPTASGKTALLMALLGEMTTLSGKIIMSKRLSHVDEFGLTHSIAYAAQSPWLRHQSIRDNILFGYPYDDTRYNAVIEACALEPDLDVLEDGDATEIGARGVSLSGGQKARVALARAVYAPAKYVLLDDPLSAVDSHTARFLFEKLLCGPLLANRTVILVTHHVELVLPGAYYLVRVLDGRIDSQGTLTELRAQGVLDEIAHSEEVKVYEGEQEAAAETPNAEEIAAEAIEGPHPTKETKKPRKLVKDEERQEGGVKWSIYNTYLKASSYWTWSILGIFIILFQILTVSERVWIMWWGDAYGKDKVATVHAFTTSSYAIEQQVVTMDGWIGSHHSTHTIHGLQIFDPPISLPSAEEHPLFFIGVYSALGLGSAFLGVLAAIVQYTGALRASRVLFKQLLVSVVRATMRWHDTTPQGRMLNRFSKDIETVDSSLASSLQAVNSSLATFAASVITVAFIFPLFLLPASAIGIVYRLLAIGYLNTGRDLRRMESNSRSPIFSGFGELLEGIVTVRAFSAEQRFLDGLHAKVDLTTQMWYSFWMTNRWLLLNFDALGALSVLITTLFALSGLVSAGLAGLCITSAMSFTNSIYWACRFWTGLELDLNSVERVVEYLELPREPLDIVESSCPPAYWPSSESENLIVVEDLVIRYAPELPPVLHNVSFTLRGRERVGLLGRTGSGKSTLAMSVLRFVDPASGRILIDGIDITTIGLHDLRSRITFIPQDATLFSGTLRENLDPFDEHDDLECLDVLHRVQMITDSAYESQRSSRQASRATSRSVSPGEDHQPPTPGSSAAASTTTEVESRTAVTLETQVSPGGTNFSQGQRQLIAMARALLRRSSIIVLDEATSSIDFATDSKIQAAIREEFGGALLLTIAHRLKTVIDYDKLMVLDKGAIAEFDTPWNLIQKEDGIFRNMAMKSGMFAELERIAKGKAMGSA